MDISLILTILGLLIAIPSIYMGWISLTRPKIKVVFDRSTILANLSKASNDISVSYKGAQVPNDLILIEGTLLNTGNTDIKKEDVEDPIEFKLLDGWKWHSFNVTHKSQGLKVHHNLDKDAVRIELGLCKKEEGFCFEALISVKEGAVLNKKELIFKNIKITSRILHLNSIEKIRLTSDFNKNSKFKNVKDFLFVNVMLIALFVFTGVSAFSQNKDKINYQFRDLDGSELMIGLDRNKNLSVINSKTSVQILSEDGYYKIKPEITVVKPKSLIVVINYSLLVITVLSFLYINFKLIEKYLLLSKIHNLMKEVDKSIKM